MRKRETVMETMGWEQKWAKIGVKAVIAPHAAADNSITFSPPTLNKSTSIYEHYIKSKQNIFLSISQANQTFCRACNIKNVIVMLKSLELQHGTNAEKRFIASFICITYFIMLGPNSEQVVALWWPLDCVLSHMCIIL